MDHAERIDELEARLRHEVATRERLEKELQEKESQYRIAIQATRESKGRHKQAEEKLPTTQEYLDTILLNLPVGIAILEGPEFRYYRINRQLAEMNGLSVEDHLGRSLAEVLPDAAPDIIPGLRHVLESGEARLNREFSTWLPKDPAVIRHFMDSFFPIYGADGKPRAVGAVVLDITERKQAEEALQRTYAELEQRVKERTAELTQSNAALQQEIAVRKQAEEELQQSQQRVQAQFAELEHLYQTTPVGLCLMDTELRYLRINEQLAEINGKPIAEHIGKTIHEVIPEIAEQVAPIYRRVIETGEPVVSAEVHGTTQANPEIPRDWLVSYYPHVSQEGTIVGVSTVVQDITERKQAAEALRESEERLRAFVEALPGLALILDEEGRYVEVFTTQEQLLYAEAARLKGKLLHEVLPDAPARLFLSTIRQAIGSGATQTLEYELEVLGGPRWFEGQVAPMPGPVGQRRMVIWISQDITERKRAKETLRLQREELAHVQRTTMMGELTAALAHEINQPLTAIRSNAQAALRFMNADTPNLDEIREILDDIVADDRRAAEVIIRLRALLQKQTVSTAPLDLNAVVGEVTGLLHSDAVIKNVAVELDLAEGLPPVLGDRVQLQQVLLNLIMNGFDAMEGVPGPERVLVIRTAQEAGSLVRVSVRDAGVGFDGQDMEELFAPFHTTKAKGMGMGLAISRSIIEAHGGKIWAEDNADRGATFHFTLPVEASA